MVDETTSSGPSEPTTPQSTDNPSDSASGQGQPSAESGGRGRRRAASRPAGPPQPVQADSDGQSGAPAPAKKAARRRTTKKTATASPGADAADAQPQTSSRSAADETSPRQSATPFAPLFQAPEPGAAGAAEQSSEPRDAGTASEKGTSAGGEPAKSDQSSSKKKRGSTTTKQSTTKQSASKQSASKQTAAKASSAGASRKKKQAGAGTGSQPATDGTVADAGQPAPDTEDSSAEQDDGQSTGSSRRRRRRRRGSSGTATGDAAGDGGTATGQQSDGGDHGPISSVDGSTRIEAKKQRRREGRDAGRRRAPILTESEFLARRESVERVMVIRQRGEVTQIAVLEDNVLVEHYVALEAQGSLIGNVYLGRVQNVLPSMEAAFIDIGKGRNAVLYAGEVNWDLRDDKNAPRRIENALKPGQSVLVQVSKDPIGHKGARLTSQISLPGRYLVYVPSGGASGISRKLPDTERNRLKDLLKDILPHETGVIIRTAAEGASEEQLTRDVNRLTARWEDIDKKVKSGKAPQLLYAEPDTTLKVIRDLFNEDFTTLVISGDDAWDMVQAYVDHVAPDLLDRVTRFDGDDDVFAHYRIDEQIAKAMERKVWLPSGGSLVLDRTEAMTVVDVNTGKFTGSGGNLEETVTKNNLEAAEEVVRQLRLRDIGGIIVIDFIDMVLESNRELVLRRLVECLGRDRTRHQVAEVTSLGLVQMTRKRIGTGLLEAFSHTCETCQGRGVIIEAEPVEPHRHEERSGGSSSGRSSRQSSSQRSGQSRSGSRKKSDSSADDKVKSRTAKAPAGGDGDDAKTGESRPPAGASDGVGSDGVGSGDSPETDQRRDGVGEPAATGGTDAAADGAPTRSRSRSRSRRAKAAASNAG